MARTSSDRYWALKLFFVCVFFFSGIAAVCAIIWINAQSTVISQHEKNGDDWKTQDEKHENPYGSIDGLQGSAYNVTFSEGENISISLPHDVMSASQFLERYNAFAHQNRSYPLNIGDPTRLYLEAIDVYPNVAIKLNHYITKDAVDEAFMFAEDINKDEIFLIRGVMQSLIGAHDPSLSYNMQEEIADTLLVDGVRPRTSQQYQYHNRFYLYEVDELGAIGFIIEVSDGKSKAHNDRPPKSETSKNEYDSTRGEPSTQPPSANIREFNAHIIGDHTERQEPGEFLVIQNGAIVRSYHTAEAAIDFASTISNTEVTNPRVVIWDNKPSIVYQGDQHIKDFETKTEAISYARQLTEAKVVNKLTDKVEWDNYPRECGTCESPIQDQY
jgi:hypothetical protein